MDSKKIIVVDDNPENQEVLQFLLEVEGYEVFVYDRAIPVEKIVEINPGLIFMDMRLPGIPGNVACKQIKAFPGTNHIPVILITTDIDIENIASACLADGFVRKPYDIDSVIEVVNKFII